jgi:glycosyltransferase involved in cell wall biosynthesis
VDAVPTIAAAIPNAVLLLILSEAPQYQKDLAALKAVASQWVRFLPSQPRSRLVEIVKAADCIVIPSIAEGFGYTTLESCASGVPVVVSQTATTPEVVGGSFVLAEARSARSIADGVLSVARGAYQTLPQRSFPWSRTIDEYEAEYRRLLER